MLRAGPDALRLVRERGLRAEDVDVIPAASGGPKWLVLAGLDRYLFGELLQRPRTRPLHLIGSSIGSWRMACLAQRDPVAALERAHTAYLEQRYLTEPTAAEVTETSIELLDALQLRRVVFHAPGPHPFGGLDDFPTEHRALTDESLRPALLASASIPLVLEGVRIAGVGMLRDGGIIDYHPHLDFGAGEGLVLYPHFYPHVVPGWFDKRLGWRRGEPL